MRLFNPRILAFAPSKYMRMNTDREYTARLGFEYDDDDREIWEYVVDPLTLVQRRMSREISIG